jgi:ribosomal protein S18 acetylase RimI-like enzyme
MVCYNDGMSVTEVIVEPARIDDVEAILQIRRDAWLDTYPNPDHGITRQMIKQRFDQVSEDKAIARWQKGIAGEGKTQITFVARVDGVVKGFTGCRQVKGRRRIGSMYVEPGLQGQGIGGQLMRRAIDWFGRDENIYLDVVSYNQRAIDFYKHFGFEETGLEVQDAVKPFENGVHIPEIEMVLRAA